MTPWQLLSGMHYVSLNNMTDLAFPSHGSLHRQLGVFVYMSGLLSTTYALQIAFYIPHTYSYQRMNFPTTLQHKKTQLIINSSNHIRSDLVFFNYFLTPQQIPIAFVILFLLQQTHPISCLLFLLKKDRSNLLAHSFLLFCYSCDRPTQFLVLFSYSKEIYPIYLLIASLTYSVLDLIAFLSFLVTINPITCLLASLTRSRSDCLIPTRWLERCRL
jgi:hypothetical protein